MNNSEQKVAQAKSQSVTTDTNKPSVSNKVKASGSLLGLTQGEISSYLMGMRDRVAQVLPKHMTPDRILQMAATTIHRNPKIAGCTPVSLLGAVMQASILGFPPVEALGYCYFVPYGKDVQFQIGYKGMIELARRSGKIKMVYAEVVREGDHFEAKFGLYPQLEHTPSFDSSKEMTHVYAVCHFDDGGHNFVVLSRSDVERLRMRSPMQKGTPSGAWATDYEAMAKAKALKQLAKYLPLNIDQTEAIASDEAVIKVDNFEAGKAKSECFEYEIVEDTEEVVNVNEQTGEVNQ